MSLQSVVRFLLPRETHFYDFLEKQASVAHEAAVALSRIKEEGISIKSVLDTVLALEHQGDALSRDMEDALARSFVTPLDREDLQKLSKEIDDITDMSYVAVRACVLMGVSRPTEPMKKLIDVLIASTTLLKETLPLLRQHEYERIVELSRAVRMKEKEGDAIFRAAISELFHDNSIDAKQLMREREVLDDLEGAVDHCADVASTLANLAVKHG